MVRWSGVPAGGTVPRRLSKSPSDVGVTDAELAGQRVAGGDGRGDVELGQDGKETGQARAGGGSRVPGGSTARAIDVRVYGRRRALCTC